MYRGARVPRLQGCPLAQRIADEVICLPIYPELSDGDQQRVIDCILGASR
jgi:dTDP-4-amino-4,6-dideoxygalactose transaminase